MYKKLTHYDRVCSMFGIKEKILLFDITNTYFEGRMDGEERAVGGTEHLEILQ